MTHLHKMPFVYKFSLCLVRLFNYFRYALGIDNMMLSS